MQDTRDVHFLNYNINWFDSVFTSKSTIEALLGPQHEAGNVSSADYNTALDFFPGFHRHYPIVGAAAGTAAGFFAPKIKISRSTLVFVSLLAGYTIGKGLKVSVHSKYLTSIENPEGFRNAIENIQKEMGVSPKRGLVMTRPFKPSHQLPSDDYTPTPLILPSESEETTPQSRISQKPLSKWDEIRHANSHKATVSTWETIRQKSQHNNMKVSKSTEEDVLDQDDNGLDTAKYRNRSNPASHQPSNDN